MEIETRYKEGKLNHAQAALCQARQLAQIKKAKAIKLIFLALRPFLASTMEKILNINPQHGLTCHKKQVLVSLILSHVTQKTQHLCVTRLMLRKVKVFQIF